MTKAAPADTASTAPSTTRRRPAARSAAKPRATAANTQPEALPAAAAEVVAEVAVPAVAAPVAAEVAPAQPTAAEASSKDSKAGKATRGKKAEKKEKLVRDSFTFPASDYALIASSKQRVIAAGVEVKKSEIVRAGLYALSQLDDAALLALVGQLEKIKTGRPSKK